MKIFGLLICLLMMAFPIKRPAFAQSAPSTDKAAHFAVSSLGVASSLKLSQWLHPEKKITPAARFFASSLLLSLGVAKEISDAKRKGEGFDTGDMISNVTGVVYGNFLMIEF